MIRELFNTCIENGRLVEVVFLSRRDPGAVVRRIGLPIAIGPVELSSDSEDRFQLIEIGHSCQGGHPLYLRPDRVLAVRPLHEHPEQDREMVAFAGVGWAARSGQWLPADNQEASAQPAPQTLCALGKERT